MSFTHLELKRLHGAVILTIIRIRADATLVYRAPDWGGRSIGDAVQKQGRVFPFASACLDISGHNLMVNKTAAPWFPRRGGLGSLAVRTQPTQEAEPIAFTYYSCLSPFRCFSHFRVFVCSSGQKRLILLLLSWRRPTTQSATSVLEVWRKALRRWKVCPALQ